MLPFAERNKKYPKPWPPYAQRLFDSHALPVKFVRHNIPDNHHRAVDRTKYRSHAVCFTQKPTSKRDGERNCIMWTNVQCLG